MRVQPYLERLAAEAMRKGLDVEADPALRPAKEAAHGDYQINGLLPLAKKLGRPPRELASPVAGALAGHPALESVEVAGPGFVNLRLRAGWVSEQLCALALDEERDGVPAVERPERIVVDFSSPNIAKRMHVGHLRSTIIGDSLVRLLRLAGHQVIGDNHLGDWGTQFGMLIAGMERFGDAERLRGHGIEELERVYLLSNQAAKDDPAFAERAREQLARLQAGDAENLAAWKRFVGATRAELDRIYRRMGVSFDEWLGESAYQQMLPGVVELLLERGIAREDQGAICVFFDDADEPGGSRAPFIVRKKDGAFLYSTTDIATVLYRRDRWRAERAIYVVDQRQSLHFKQLFAVMSRLGVQMRLEHVGFGTVLGEDGKPLRTREGGAVRLDELLDEAERRAAERMRQEEGLSLGPAEIAELGPLVGIGAIKYADLKQNRLSDYQFDWDKMLSFKGNSGPYLQYAHARIRSIFRKAGIEPGAAGASDAPGLQHPAEIDLGKHLIRFADAVHEAAESGYPHLVCDHLYALARLFSVFYETCPVLRAESGQREDRLLLSLLVARQIKRGLGLLGIGAPDRM
jgi:arginyl-tRNA synthetase